MELITLTVERHWQSSYSQTTILKTADNKIKAIFNSSIRQPKRGQKTIVVNCWTYKLDWSNVPSKYIPVKERELI